MGSSGGNMPKGIWKRPRPTIEQRFFKYTFPDPTTGCWLWGGNMGRGYGRIQTNPTILAHRWSYTFHKGPIPADASILHSCDVKECVNPDHLRPGTQRENVHDAFLRNRMGNGEARGNYSKLRKQDVYDIRLLLFLGLSHRSLARKYKVDKRTISHIKIRKTWKHI